MILVCNKVSFLSTKEDIKAPIGTPINSSKILLLKILNLFSRLSKMKLHSFFKAASSFLVFIHILFLIRIV